MLDCFVIFELCHARPSTQQCSETFRTGQPLVMKTAGRAGFGAMVMGAVLRTFLCRKEQNCYGRWYWTEAKGDFQLISRGPYSCAQNHWGNPNAAFTGQL